MHSEEQSRPKIHSRPATAERWQMSFLPHSTGTFCLRVEVECAKRLLTALAVALSWPPRQRKAPLPTEAPRWHLACSRPQFLRPKKGGVVLNSCRGREEAVWKRLEPPKSPSQSPLGFAKSAGASRLRRGFPLTARRAWASPTESQKPWQSFV